VTATARQSSGKAKPLSAKFEQLMVNAWYGGARWLVVLRPLSWLFRMLAARRRRRLIARQSVNWRPPVPVIVVGNISVGGTGKTPLVISLLEKLRESGYRPGVVSRGYGAKPRSFPFLVTPESGGVEAGDEALLISQRTACPVVIDADRVGAARELLKRDVDVIVSDDGLQHYRLARDVEIIVVDGQRGLGNGRCLPEGPLREPPSRLAEADLVVVNGSGDVLPGVGALEMQLKPAEWVRLSDGKTLDLEAWRAEHPGPVRAFAGTGNPKRFFDTLRQLGITSVEERSFPDHWAYSAADLACAPGETLVMTEKDAVKCRGFAPDDCWFLRVYADINNIFYNKIENKVKVIARGFA
jgi:tetraacyldisaccharide 4'-kinase